MAFDKTGPKYRVTKMVEARKLHPNSLIPLSEPPIQLPFTAILEGMRLEREMYRFYYLGQPYQCAQKVLKSAIEKIEDAAAKAVEEEMEEAAEVVKADPVVEAAPAPRGAARAGAGAGGFVWQPVQTNKGAMLRGKVAGGWLVRVEGSVCFYPDAGHKWDGGTLD
ncbi:MAG: hypothetical protein IH602_24140 [Bryobacteraceae bacterium]|nr:hypothetical protein [Bryobacteraceae bacterium]